MKIVSINKVKVKVFEENELKEKFKLNDNQVELILKYQRTFPELLQDEEGFCIDGEILCKELGVGGNFNDWLLADRKGKEGKLIKYRCIENADYINDCEIANVNFSKDEVRQMSSQQRSRQGIKNIIKLTLECAKKIAMRQNNEMGDLVCDYFILMESTLRNNAEWIKVREPEKQGFNEMKKYIVEWCDKLGYDSTLDIFFSREADMLNEALTGMKAKDIKWHLGYKNKITRDHLDVEINKALSELQALNISLLIAQMSFDERKIIIKSTCDRKYSHLKFC